MKIEYTTQINISEDKVQLVFTKDSDKEMVEQTYTFTQLNPDDVSRAINEQLIQAYQSGYEEGKDETSN